MVVPRVDFDERLKEIGTFFEERDRVYQTMARVIATLTKARIPYALLGCMAVNAHGHRRTTGDVDVLVTVEGLRGFLAIHARDGFERDGGRPLRFRDLATSVSFDFRVAGRFPGSGRPGPIAFPRPESVRVRIRRRWVVQLATLVELKLAARRHRDFGDVVELIRCNDLDESFLAKLHPSVQRDFIECLEEKRREDAYEAREAAAARRLLAEEDETE